GVPRREGDRSARRGWRSRLAPTSRARLSRTRREVPTDGRPAAWCDRPRVDRARERSRLLDRRVTRRTQAERSEATRGALLDAARELFAANGFAATGRDEIAARAGVTRGALYHHFASKEALFRAVVEQLEEELAARIIAAAAKEPDPRQHLRVGCHAFLD